MPFQYGELLHRFAGIDSRMSVPAGGSENLAVGAVLEALLARVLGLDYFERFELGVPDVFT